MIRTPPIVTGAVAGLVGTATMTVAQAVEMRLTGREPSLVPGRVACKLLRLQPNDERELSRISIAMHWAHGATMGALRAGLGLAGLKGSGAAATHFALMWSGDAMLYKALYIAPWPWQCRMDELAPYFLHKRIYAMATGAAYDRVA